TAPRGLEGSRRSCARASCSTGTRLRRWSPTVLGLGFGRGSRQRTLGDGRKQLVSGREKQTFQARTFTTPANRQGLLALSRGEGHGRSFLVPRPSWTLAGRPPRPDDSLAHTQAAGAPWGWLSEQLYPGLPDCRRGHNAPLRCTLRSGEQDALLQEACFQP